MYFLNGDRIFIKPGTSNADLNEQLNDCLQQLCKINSGKKIFKLNFFVDVDTESDYLQLQKELRKRVNCCFDKEVLISLIAQPPLTEKLIIEAFYFDSSLWDCQIFIEGNNGMALFQNDSCSVLCGTVHANKNSNCRLNSEKAFDDLVEMFSIAQMPFNSIVRQWNYIEDILGFDEEDQRYQEFNNVRSKFYGNLFEKKGYPAATGIGMNHGGVLIEFIAVNSDSIVTCPVDNPEQISAHKYSEKVLIGEQCSLKTTPKFERARYFQLSDKKMIFISGTASITGEKTVGINDAAQQTEVTISNIKQLYSEKSLAQLAEKNLQPQYGHARVYVKKREDFEQIKNIFEKHYDNLPVVYIIADICRNNLLVEIEGKVVLK